MIYYGSPAFFVEASDSLMLDRASGSCSRPPARSRNSSFRPSLRSTSGPFPSRRPRPSSSRGRSSTASWIFLNLVPLLELDGYFILADLIRVPDLRPRSLQFIRYDLWRKIRGRERVTKQEGRPGRLRDRRHRLHGVLPLDVDLLLGNDLRWVDLAVVECEGVIGKALPRRARTVHRGPDPAWADLARARGEEGDEPPRQGALPAPDPVACEAAELLDRSAMFDDLPGDIALGSRRPRVNLEGYPAERAGLPARSTGCLLHRSRTGSLEVPEEDLKPKERVIRYPRWRYV